MDAEFGGEVQTEKIKSKGRTTGMECGPFNIII